MWILFSVRWTFGPSEWFSSSCSVGIRHSGGRQTLRFSQRSQTEIQARPAYVCGESDRFSVTSQSESNLE